MAFCTRCGKPTEDGSNFCAECKSVVNPAQVVNQPYAEQYAQQNFNQQVPPPPPPPQYQQPPYQQPYQQYQQPYPPYQQPYPPYQQPYPPYQQPAVPDAPSTGFAVLGFFFPLVGLILYLVWKDKTPLKAKSCGKGALIGFIVNTAVSIISYVVSYAFAYETMSAALDMYETIKIGFGLF